MKFVAKTLHGLEDILIQELKDLGAKEINKLKRAVSFEGDKELLYRANYELRTAIRILKPIYNFTARSERQLYHKIFSYNWAMHFDNKKTIAISSSVYSDFFNHSQYVALKTKDAIVDQFRNKTGKRPDIDTRNPDIWLNVHVYEDEFTVSLDSSGNSLHRRGYRDMGHMAPLNEVLSAGMLLMAGYKGHRLFKDPMCGTGTNLFEAAMIAANIPAAYYRKDKYCFMNWNDYEESIFEKIKVEAEKKINREGVKIEGGDNNPSSINMTQDVIDELGFGDMIEIEKIPFKRNLPESEMGLMIMNPPYGERLKTNDIESFYAMIGDTLKNHYSGWSAWIISSNFDALKHIGLRPSFKTILFNGSLECKYQKFSMYQGSKKSKYNS